MSKVVGIIIAVLTGLAFAAGLAVAVIQWVHGQPETRYRTVGVRYKVGTTKPWPGMEDAIDVMLEHLDHIGREDLGVFWVEVVAWNDLIKMAHMQPSDPSIVGTVRVEPYFGGLVKRYVLSVKQRVLTTGKPDAVKRSSLFHEFAEHYLPWRIEGNWNTGHDPSYIPTRQLLERDMP